MGIREEFEKAFIERIDFIDMCDRHQWFLEGAKFMQETLMEKAISDGQFTRDNECCIGSREIRQLSKELE